MKGLVYPVPDPRYPFRHSPDPADRRHGRRRAKRGAGSGVGGLSANRLLPSRRPGRGPSKARRSAASPARIGGPAPRRCSARSGSAISLHMPESTCPRSAQRPAPSAGWGSCQAIRKNGQLVDDVWVIRRSRLTLVRNARSPAAMSSLAIAEHSHRARVDSAEP